MSEEETDAADTSLSCCCASCGIAEIDDIKLVPCDGCDLVRYCSDECQGEHKSEHEEECKKRAAELRDELLLFKQPESSYLGDCPICSLPMPLDKTKSTLTGCCSEIICRGCSHANQMREFEARVEQRCPFCRERLPDTLEEDERRRMKRIEVNDPVAMLQQARKQYDKGEYRSAFEYDVKAAELGEIDAHYRLAHMYCEGLGVEKDEEKQIHHTEEAAIGGHPTARYNLGRHELENGNAERAVKHWIIAATQGYDLSIKMLMKAFKEGFVEKDVLTTTLRAHKAAVDATKSPQRDEAEAFPN